MKLLFCSDIRWESSRERFSLIDEKYAKELAELKWLKGMDLMFPERIRDKKLKRKVLEIINNKMNEIARKNVQKIIKIFRNEKPDGIFLLGDIVNDGSCTFSHENELFSVLKWANSMRINTFLIQGNHDYYSAVEYRQLLSKIEDMEYIREISGKKIVFQNLSILAIPFEITSRDKTGPGKIKKFLGDINDNFDFVIAHSDYRRRIWLTDLPTKYIVTGHYGQGYVFSPEGRLLLSTDGFPMNYLNFDLSKDKVILNYNDISFGVEKDMVKIELNLREKNVSITGNKFFFEKLECMRKDEETRLRILKEAKIQFFKSNSDSERRSIIKSLSEKGILVTHVREYIRDQTWIRDLYKQMKKSDLS